MVSEDENETSPETLTKRIMEIAWELGFPSFNTLWQSAKRKIFSPSISNRDLKKRVLEVAEIMCKSKAGPKRPRARGKQQGTLWISVL